MARSAGGPPRTRRIPIVGIVVAIPAMILALAIAGFHPVAPASLLALLIAYAGALWWKPQLWLVALPVVIPALALAPWTGWLMVGEHEPFLLVTLGVLLIRSPPEVSDLHVPGWPGRLLLIGCAVACIGLGLGLMDPDTPMRASALPMLAAENAVRLFSAPLGALALLPFLASRQRTHGDAAALLSAGMVLGLGMVGALVVIERGLFVGVLDISRDYRVVGPFASMHFGGGHIGAYLAMALPFLVWCLPRPAAPRGGQTIRPELPNNIRLVRIDRATGAIPRDPSSRPLATIARLAIGSMVGALGAYTLLVAFARSALAISILSVAVAVVLFAVAISRGRRAPVFAILAAIGLLAALGGIGVAFAVLSPRMAGRLETVTTDMRQREANWTGGLAFMDHSVPRIMFGMGTGTYPRLVLARGDRRSAPSDLVIANDAERRLLRMFPGSPLYLGQKVTLTPSSTYALSVTLRAPDTAATLSVALCEKLLLYSDNCRAVAVPAQAGLGWRTVTSTLESGPLGTPRFLGLARPVELSLFPGRHDAAIDIAHVSLRGPDGKEVIANGNWSDGLTRWYPTDDDHLVWQIKNQYLMLFVEGGVFGLMAFLMVALSAVAGAVRSVLRGEIHAAPVAASLIAFLCAGLLDYLTGAPRLSMLFWLLVAMGLTLGRPRGLPEQPRRGLGQRPIIATAGMDRADAGR